MIKQISVFVDNTPGSLAQFTRMLGEKRIDMISLSIADTANFGILRGLVRNPEQAAMQISAAGYTACVSDVLAVEVPDRPGGLSEVLQKLSENGVGIEYRLIAEDPDNRFTPWVGRIERFSWQEQPWLTVLTHVPTDEPYEIPTEFDPNLALAIVWGKDLDEARARGREFLDGLVLEGRNAAGDSLKSNVKFLRANTERILRF